MNLGQSQSDSFPANGSLAHKLLFFSLSGPFCKPQPDQTTVLDIPPGCCSEEKFCCWAEEGTVCLYQVRINPSDPFRESNHWQTAFYFGVRCPRWWWQPKLHPYQMTSVKQSICYYSLSLQSSSCLVGDHWGHLHF